jgi:hypothetical protein
MKILFSLFTLLICISVVLAGSCTLTNGPSRCVVSTSGICAELNGIYDNLGQCGDSACQQIQYPLNSSVLIIASTSVNNNNADLLFNGIVVYGGSKNLVSANKFVTGTQAIQYTQSAQQLYNQLNTRVCTSSIPSTVSTARTFTPGVHCFSTEGTISTTTLTFSGAGIYIIKVPNNLIMQNVNYVLTNGANAGNIYWLVGQSTSINNYAIAGTFISPGSFNINNLGLNGRLWSFGASVTMNNVVISNNVIDSCPSYDLNSIVPLLGCWSSIPDRAGYCKTNWGYHNKNDFKVLAVDRLEITGCDNEFPMIEVFKIGVNTNVIQCIHPCSRKVGMSIYGGNRVSTC